MESRTSLLKNGEHVPGGAGYCDELP